MKTSYPDEPELDQELEDILGPFYLRYSGLQDENDRAQAAIKLGRNERCPCGSGKKVKACHGGIKAGAIQTSFQRADYLISRPPSYWVKDTSSNGLAMFSALAMMGASMERGR